MAHSIRDRRRVASAGAGNISSIHAEVPSLTDRGALVAVVDLTPDHARAAGARWDLASMPFTTRSTMTAPRWGLLRFHRARSKFMQRDAR